MAQNDTTLHRPRKLPGWRVVATGSGFRSDEREVVKTWVHQFGAQYSGDLVCRKSTHLVCRDLLTQFGTTKYQKAMEWGIAIVSYRWIYDSLQAGRYLSIERYQSDESGPADVALRKAVALRRQQAAAALEQARVPLQPLCTNVTSADEGTASGEQELVPIGKLQQGPGAGGCAESMGPDDTQSSCPALQQEQHQPSPRGDFTFDVPAGIAAALRSPHLCGPADAGILPLGFLGEQPPLDDTPIALEEGQAAAPAAASEVADQQPQYELDGSTPEMQQQQQRSAVPAASMEISLSKLGPTGTITVSGSDTVVTAGGGGGNDDSSTPTSGVSTDEPNVTRRAATVRPTRLDLDAAAAEALGTDDDCQEEISTPAHTASMAPVEPEVDLVSPDCLDLRTPGEAAPDTRGDEAAPQGEERQAPQPPQSAAVLYSGFDSLADIATARKGHRRLVRNDCLHATAGGPHENGAEEPSLEDLEDELEDSLEDDEAPGPVVTARAAAESSKAATITAPAGVGASRHGDGKPLLAAAAEPPPRPSLANSSVSVGRMACYWQQREQQHGNEASTSAAAAGQGRAYTSRSAAGRATVARAAVVPAASEGNSTCGLSLSQQQAPPPPPQQHLAAGLGLAQGAPMQMKPESSLGEGDEQPLARAPGRSQMSSRIAPVHHVSAAAAAGAPTTTAAGVPLQPPVLNPLASIAVKQEPGLPGTGSGMGAGSNSTARPSARRSAAALATSSLVSEPEPAPALPAALGAGVGSRRRLAPVAEGPTDSVDVDGLLSEGYESTQSAGPTPSGIDDLDDQPTTSVSVSHRRRRGCALPQPQLTPDEQTTPDGTYGGNPLQQGGPATEGEGRVGPKAGPDTIKRILTNHTVGLTPLPPWQTRLVEPGAMDYSDADTDEETPAPRGVRRDAFAAPGKQLSARNASAARTARSRRAPAFADSEDDEYGGNTPHDAENDAEAADTSYDDDQDGFPSASTGRAGRTVQATRPATASLMASQSQAASQRSDRQGSEEGSWLQLALTDDRSISRYLRKAASMADEYLAGLGRSGGGLYDNDVRVVKALSRPPRTHTVRVFHPGVVLKQVTFAEQVLVEPLKLLLNCRDRTRRARCPIIALSADGGSGSSKDAPREVFLAEPCVIYRMPSGEWWLEYYRFYSESDLAAMAAASDRTVHIPTDFEGRRELVRDTDTAHCRLTNVRGDLGVMRAKAIPPVPKPGRPGERPAFCRHVFDKHSGKTLTNVTGKDLVIDR